MREHRSGKQISVYPSARGVYYFLVIHDFQKPRNNWLCVFTVIWVLAAAFWAFHFVAMGKFLAAGVMCFWALCAVGLWFQVRLAAWVLMIFAGMGIIYSLTKIGHVPWYRVASPICWAVWAIFLLWEFLYGREEGGDEA
jgi:hypothetical protein